jgi:hypothetical protein
MKKLLLKLSILVTAFSLVFSLATSFAASSYYVNSTGQVVHVPVKAVVIPKGATARCKDGTYSFSKHRSGTCSGHRGVSKWL